ncbi:MAG: NepR family anti-sigma factor [Methylocystis sp.]|uniref:NepR family anti-sigma factor n=1 Tax=Methylocystis sp. TaxID=1911079 RepID=UPI003DA64B79
MLITDTDTLSPEDAALIEREAGSVMRTLYGPVVHEPLPDHLAVLLEQLAVQEGRGGGDGRGGPS